IVQPLRFHPPNALCSSPHDGSAKSASLFSHGQPFIPLKNCRLARRREDQKMVPRDQAIRDTRTTESRFRDSRTESGREWPRNRLCEVRRKCIRHKPRERGEKSTLWRSSAYVISNT